MCDGSDLGRDGFEEALLIGWEGATREKKVSGQEGMSPDPIFFITVSSINPHLLHFRFLTFLLRVCF